MGLLDLEQALPGPLVELCRHIRIEDSLCDLVPHFGTVVFERLHQSGDQYNKAERGPIVDVVRGLDVVPGVLEQPSVEE